MLNQDHQLKMKKEIIDLKEARTAAIEGLNAIVGACKEEKRAKSKEEVGEFAKLEERIGEIDAQINRLARDIRSSIESEYRTAASQEQALAQQVEGFKTETLEEQNRRVELNLLAREVDTNRTQYDALLERYKNVSTASDVVTNNITIIDEANSALQVAPRWPINMAIALLAGLGLAAGLAFLRETWNNTVGSTDDVQRKLSLPVLGVTPIVEMDQTLLAELGDPKSVLSEFIFLICDLYPKKEITSLGFFIFEK